MKPADFHAAEGEPIAPLLKRFSRFVLRESRVRVEGPARVHRTASGKRVVYEPPRVIFPGSFRVRVEGSRRVIVGEGLVAGLVPFLDGRRLDGLDDEGEPDPAGVPRLDCDGPGPEGRSWVLLLATATEKGDLDVEAEAPVEVVHRKEIPEGMREEGRLVRLVAALRWRGEGESATIQSVRQIVWYDQEIYSVDGEARWRAAA